MGFKRSALAVVIATMAINAVVAASAGATTGGHFTSEVAHTTLSGSASGGHATEFAFDGGTPIICSSGSYSGTANEVTVTELGVTPAYSSCKTEGGEVNNVTIHSNSCSFTLRIGKKAVEDNTMQLSCPEKSLEITHPNCTIKIPSQAFGSGAAYTATTESGKAALTVDLTATSITAHYEGGLCVLLETSHTATLSGSFVLSGRDTAGGAVGIEATGSEEPRFRFENTHTAFTGTQTTASKTTFGVLLGSVECSTATLDGTTTGSEDTQITVVPAYFGCSGSGREVTTHTNGCAYVLTVTGTAGSVHIECPSGKSIETTIDKFPEGCTITIPAQTAGGVVDYEEKGEGTGRDLLLTWTLEGIKYVRDGCEVGGEGNNGTMGGSITLSGEDTSGNPKGIWIE